MIPYLIFHKAAVFIRVLLHSLLGLHQIASRHFKVALPLFREVPCLRRSHTLGRVSSVWEERLLSYYNFKSAPICRRTLLRIETHLSNIEELHPIFLISTHKVS